MMAMMAIHDPFILAGGSDSLDVNVLPSSIAQIISFLIFVMVSVFYIKLGRKKRTIILTIFLLLSVFSLLTNGHSFTISGKKHAIVDKWFIVPVQSIPIDPTEEFESVYYKDYQIGVLIEQEKSSMFVFTGAGIIGIDGNQVIKLLNDFGAKERSED